MEDNISIGRKFWLFNGFSLKILHLKFTRTECHVKYENALYKGTRTMFLVYFTTYYYTIGVQVILYLNSKYYTTLL